CGAASYSCCCSRPAGITSPDRAVPSTVVAAHEHAMCGCPLRWHKKLRHYSQLAENFYADSGPVLQNECRLAKQRRALQECNWPRNNQPETHRDDEPGSGGFAAP